MRLRRALADRLEIARTGPPPSRLTAVLIAGFAVAIVIETEPGWHWAVAAAFVALAAAMLFGKMPPRWVLSLPDATLRGADRSGVVRTLGLVGEADGRRLTYRVEAAVGERGVAVSVLEGPDPAEIAADAGEIAARARVPVRPGWGLQQGAEPWRRDGAVLRSSSREGEVRIRPEGRRRIALTFALCVVVLCAGLGSFVVARFERGQTTSPLSLTLLAVTVALATTAAAAVATEETRVRGGKALIVERRVLGMARTLRRVERSALRGAWPVSPDGGVPRHVLVATSDGPFAIPCDGTSAADVLALIA